jgi:hypothetical protein
VTLEAFGFVNVPTRVALNLLPAGQRRVTLRERLGQPGAKGPGLGGHMSQGPAPTIHLRLPIHVPSSEFVHQSTVRSLCLRDLTLSGAGPSPQFLVFASQPVNISPEHFVLIDGLVQT